MGARRLALGGVLILSLSTRASGRGEEGPTADSAKVPGVLVELFTSQGCSSCPPADRLLARLGTDATIKVVPLSFHVDFWNSLGWTDPFSGHAWTLRQEAYARAFRLDGVYTPQAVVDGGAEMNGADEARLRAAIRAAAGRPAAVLKLDLETADSQVDAHVNVDLPEALRGRKLDLWVALFETGLVTSVARGENGGSALHNDYVVRRLEHAQTIPANGTGRSQSSVRLRFDRDWKRPNLGVAAFVQDPRSLEVRGATSERLGETASR